MSGGNNGS
jgi:hypothetical protein